MTFLELAKDFVRELGIAGGTGPSTVENQSGELGNVVRWIRDSNLYIDNLWLDWKYLWREHRISIAAATTRPTLPAFGVRMWHRHEFCLNRDSASRRDLEYQAWRDFTRNRVKPSSAHVITERPDGVLLFDGPTAAIAEFYGECQREPVILTANSDEPMMPVAFHRIIIARAAIMYGNREDAPEVISGMEAEYTDLLEKLEAVCLPDREHDRLAHYESEAQAIPGF